MQTKAWNVLQKRRKEKAMIQKEEKKTKFQQNEGIFKRGIRKRMQARKKKELEFRKKQEESAKTQQNLMVSAAT